MPVYVHNLLTLCRLHICKSSETHVVECYQIQIQLFLKSKFELLSNLDSKMKFKFQNEI